MSELLELEGLRFEIRRSTRRRTLGLTLERSGGLTLHAPSGTEQSELAEWARTKMLWVHRAMERKARVPTPYLVPEYVAGETFRYLGKPYPLVLVEEQGAPLFHDGSRFILVRSERPADHLFRRWYLGAGASWIPQRIHMLQFRVARAPEYVNVRDLGFRWASCGRTGSINVNWRLLQLPVRVIDYVLVRELCHLVERGHNRRFWQAVERALPDWQERKSQLGESAASAYWCDAERFK